MVFRWFVAHLGIMDSLPTEGNSGKNRIVKALLLLPALLLVSCGSDRVARYKLVPVTLTPESSTSTEYKGIFKLDTVSGRTWVYSVVQEKDKFVAEWIEVGGKQ